MESGKKTIGVNIPCFNEVENVVPLCEELISMFGEQLPEYDYRIQFIDNASTDGTQEKLRNLCAKYEKVRAILNIRNFKGNSALYGLLQAEGDCVVHMAADFQDPVEKIPELVKKWEEGYAIVAATKTSSKENIIKYKVRAIYYNLMKKFSKVGFIEQFCNFGVYDRRFLDILATLKRPNYSIRGNVAEFGYDIARVEYQQQERRSGKSNYNVWKLMGLAITNFVDYTDVILQAATVLGAFSSVICLVIAIVFFVLKLTRWSEYPMGTAPLLIGIFLIGSIQIFMLGVIGEYITSIKTKVSDVPLVIERERLNFGEGEKEDAV